MWLIVGGLGFTVKDIGVSSSISAALLTPFSLVAYPLVSTIYVLCSPCQMFRLLMCKFFFWHTKFDVI